MGDRCAIATDSHGTRTVVRNELAYEMPVPCELGPYSACMNDRLVTQKLVGQYQSAHRIAYRLGPAPNPTPWLGGSCPETGESCSALSLFSWAAQQGWRSPFGAGLGLEHGEGCAKGYGID